MLFLNKKFNKEFNKEFIKNLSKTVSTFILLLTVCNVSLSDEFKNLIINGSDRVSAEYLYKELKLDNITNLNNKITLLNKKLSNIEFIQDYKVNFNQGKIYVDIQEKKLIKKINFDGNKKIKKEDIKKNISISNDSFFDQKILESDIEKIKEMYKNFGFLSATINYEVEDIGDNLININIKIDEKNKTKIKKITFVGNKNMKDSLLRERIASKQDFLLRFGISKDFVVERLEYDKYLLDTVYKENGYLDFVINDVKYTFSDDNKFVYIEFDIFEGEKYEIGEITVKKNINDFDEKIILDNIKIKIGECFNVTQLREDIETLNKILNKEDLNFISIIPDVSKIDTNKVKLIFYVNKNPMSYIGKININGNFRTYEHVIRDIIGISEGELLNENLIKEAKQNLIVSGFFKNVDIFKKPYLNSNKVDLDINLEEDKFGSVGIGIGYSTLDKLNANFNIQQKNLFGRSIRFDVGINYSEYRKNYNIGFGKPNIFNSKMFGGFDIYHTENMYSKYSNNDMNFDEKYSGIDLYASYRISSSISQKFYYTFTRKLNFNIADNYGDILEKGNIYISMIGTSLIYDTRSDMFYPLNGSYGNLDIGVAGLLGGNKNYIKTTVDFSKYFNIYKKLVFKTQFSTGYITSFNGKDLYPSDGFYIGGSKLRGFKYGSAGPRIRNMKNGLIDDGEAIGGTNYYVFNAELRFPIINKSGMRIFGLFFYNAGLSKNFENNKNINLNRIVDSDKIRSACGFATVFSTPVGNIGLEFSNILSKEYYDEIDNFRINFGMDF